MMSEPAIIPFQGGEEPENGEEMHVQFQNELGTDANIFWENPLDQNEVHFGLLKDGELKEVTTSRDQVWHARDRTSNEILHTVSVRTGGLYRLVPSAELVMRREVLARSREQFLRDYKGFTGRDWITVYPRAKTLHAMLSPGDMGSVQEVSTRANYFDADSQQPLKLSLETLSTSPVIFHIRDFLSAAEADTLIAMADGKLERSTIVNEDGTGLVESDIRTSTTCWLRYSASPLVENVFNRAADLLGISREFLKFQASESLQVVHYNVSEEFRHHHDYLDPVSHSGSGSVARGNNRMATLLFSLLPAEEGGETDFPFSNGAEGGLTLKPQKGSAILFYNMLPDGNLDVNSFHAGLPVKKGEKYIANFWTWDRVYK